VPQGHELDLSAAERVGVYRHLVALMKVGTCHAMLEVKKNVSQVGCTVTNGV
jgi:hypothetical protein